MTDRKIKAIKPTNKGVEYLDEKVPGLALRVTPNGAKSWTVRYRHRGRLRRMGCAAPDIEGLGCALCRVDCSSPDRAHAAGRPRGRPQQCDRWGERGMKPFESALGFAPKLYVRWIDHLNQRLDRCGLVPSRTRRLEKPLAGQHDAVLQHFLEEAEGLDGRFAHQLNVLTVSVQLDMKAPIPGQEGGFVTEAGEELLANDGIGERLSDSMRGVTPN